MRLDSSLVFSNSQSLVAGAGVSIPSTNVIDILGLGVGVAPTAIIGNASLFGEDIGIGDGMGIPRLLVTVGTTFVTANAATLNVQLQGAVDTAVTHQPGTWNTFVETGAIAAANLAAPASSTDPTGVIARLDIAPAFPAGTLPRYLRLNYSIPAATDFSAGVIGFAGIVPNRDDQSNRYSSSNFAVA